MFIMFITFYEASTCVSGIKITCTLHILFLLIAPQKAPGAAKYCQFCERKAFRSDTKLKYGKLRSHSWILIRDWSVLSPQGCGGGISVLLLPKYLSCANLVTLPYKIYALLASPSNSWPPRMQYSWSTFTSEESSTLK